MNNQDAATLLAKVITFIESEGVAVHPAPSGLIVGEGSEAAKVQPGWAEDDAWEIDGKSVEINSEEGSVEVMWRKMMNANPRGNKRVVLATLDDDPQLLSKVYNESYRGVDVLALY